MGKIKKNELLYVFKGYSCKGYNDFSQKFATQYRRRFRPHKVYTRMFLISIIKRVDPSVVSTQISLSVLKLLGTSRIVKRYPIAPMGMIIKCKKYNFDV